MSCEVKSLDEIFIAVGVISISDKDDSDGRIKDRIR